MLRSLIACCVIGSCLALTGCEPPKAPEKPAEPPAAAKDAPAPAADAAKPGDDKKADIQKPVKKKGSPSVTTAK
jgi:hypothetical protein